MSRESTPLANAAISVERIKKSRVSEVAFSNLPFGTVFSDHMLVADYSSGQWAAPRILPYGPISIAPAASALHYGQSIFEGFKAFRQQDGGIAIFRISDNLVRMQRSAQRLAMPEMNTAALLDGIVELVRLDRDWVPKIEGSSLYIRPVYFATEETLLVRPAATYRFAVMTCPVGPYFSEPLRLLAEETYVRAFPGGTGATKAAGNYAGSLLAGRLAQEKGFHSVLWLDGLTRNFVEESGLMNIFFVIDGVAVTPPLGGTILPGVTRDSIITLLRETDIAVSERPIAMEELIAAHKTGQLTEGFAAGTAATIAPIACMRYRDYDLHFTVQPDTSVATQVRARLESLRTGRAPDPRHWLLRV
jgi:branched-chain amino acid aminotransferase